LRGDRAYGPDIAVLVLLFQSLDIPGQHILGHETFFVNDDAGEKRLPLKGVRHKLRDRLARTDGPAMIFVETDFLWAWTIDNTALAKVIRAVELADRNRAHWRLRRRTMTRRGREVEEIAGGITDASTADERKRSQNNNGEYFH
jgi:hypothetical protein